MCSAECDLLAKVDAWWLALSSAAPPDTPLSAQVTTALKASRALAVRLRKLADAAEGGLRLRFLSLELLGRHLQLQLLQRPAEAVERLEEVKACVDEMTGEGAAGAREEGKPAVVEVVIDLLLSMMEQVSGHTRDMCKHVLRAWGDELNEASIELFVNVIKAKEAEDEEEEEEGDDDDDDDDDEDDDDEEEDEEEEEDEYEEE